MPFQIRCACGKNLNIQDEWVGKQIRCSNCNEVITVTAPATAKDDDDVAAAVSAAPTKKSPASSGYGFEDEDDDRPRSKKRRDDDDEDDEDDDRPRKKRRSMDDDDDRLRTPGRLPADPHANNTTPNASIGMGILMMVGAIVWFVGGLFADIIFFYPPILFVLGIVAVVRGAMKRE